MRRDEQTGRPGLEDGEGGGQGMMLRLRKGEEKPPGARIMTDDEVLKMQHNIILQWQPRSQMWPFSWGIGILGGGATLSGILVNNVCRQRLGLQHFGRLATFGPTVVLPVILTTLFHQFIITNRILVGDFPCTVCAAIRSGSLQSAAGGLYPMVLGPLTCVVIARKYHTYYVPGIRETGQILPFMRRIMPGPGVLLAILLANFGLGMAMAERETLLFAKHLSPSSSSLEKSGEEELFQ
ncbi:hypothetical protein ACOMHN_018285 [Nucella lapillus]